MYFEDVDLAERLSRRGWLHVYAPSAVVTHEGGHATRREPHRMQRVHHTSALRYLVSYVSGRVAAGARFQRRAEDVGGAARPSGQD
jgi:N-acetylglucosaminyl-diphospho-decaprenol L-rhamnosyltransferase